MAKPASHSLRRRLLGSVMTAIVLAALFQAVSAYRGALRQADAMFDYHLQQMAYALRGGPLRVLAEPPNVHRVADRRDTDAVLPGGCDRPVQREDRRVLPETAPGIDQRRGPEFLDHARLCIGFDLALIDLADVPGHP